MLTDAQRKTVDELHAKVDGLLGRARTKAKEIEEAASYLAWIDDLPWWVPLPGKPLIQAAKELMANDTERQMAGAVRDAEEKVLRWRGPSGLFYTWMLRGKRDDGTDYTFAHWLEVGNAMAGELAQAMGEFYHASTITVLDQTVSAVEEELATAARDVAETVVETVKDAVPELPTLGLGTKLLLGAVGVVAVTGVAAIAWESVKATPVGLALRGAKLVADKSVLGTGARRAGAALKGAVERAEAKPHSSGQAKPRQVVKGGARKARSAAQPVVVNVQMAQPGRGKR
ncbi:hypothetical protein ACLEPN_22005 [Myxococcus sp. 1LA]